MNKQAPASVRSPFSGLITAFLNGRFAEFPQKLRHVSVEHSLRSLCSPEQGEHQAERDYTMKRRREVPVNPKLTGSCTKG